MEPDSFGIAVECSQSNNIIDSCSGIKICDHFCICHSSLVSTFLTKYFAQGSIDLSTDWTQFGNDLTNHLLDLKLSFQIYEPCFGEQNQSFIRRSGFLHQLIVSSQILKIYHLLTGEEWSFRKDGLEDSSSSAVQAVFMSSFIFIQTSLQGNLKRCLQCFKRKICQPIPGEIVFIDSCPFGGNAPSLFLNSISKGIVGNLSSDGEIFLTDARCSLGCEGAPVYALRHQNTWSVCGLVVSPFCWLKGEWIGLSFVAAIEPLVRYLLNDEIGSITNEIETIPYRFRPRLYIESENDRLMPKVAELLSRCVVRIHTRDGKFWGSGVVVHGAQGIVVTCGHVANHFPTEDVYVSFADNTLETGKIIFKSPNSSDEESSIARDVAIIQITPQSLFIPLSKSLPFVGSELLIGGFPFFSKSTHKAPTFSSGNLAKIYAAPPEDDNGSPGIDQLVKSSTCTSNWRHYSFNISNYTSSNWKKDDKTCTPIPFLLQITCPVYSGISGGPVVALHPLKGPVGPVVVGIVTCCLKDTNGDSHFPTISFATPSWLLAEAVDRFLLTKDRNAFDLLKKKCKNTALMSIFNKKVYAKL